MAAESRARVRDHYLEAYVESWKCADDEEQWKIDHEEVKRRLYRFEDKLDLGLFLCDAITQSYRKWFGRVQSGEQEYRTEDNTSFREGFEWWLEPCDHVTKQLEEVEGVYGAGAVERGREFRRRCEEIRRLVSEWPTPKPPAIRVAADTNRTLSDEQVAGELNRYSRIAPPSVPFRHPPDHSRVF